MLSTLVVGAAPAAAATTVGSSNLSSSSVSTPITCSAFPSCVLVLDQVDGAAVGTPKGVITSWSVRNASGTIALRVLRGRGAFVDDQLHATNISESLDQSGSGSDTAPQRFDAGQPVEAGDYIGITLVSGSSIGDLHGSDDQICEVNGDLGVFYNDVESTTPETFEPLLSATVEPDADGDGYGDENEDACPSSAATHGTCPVFTPPPPPPASTAATRKVGLGSRSASFKGGKAAIKLTNANAVGVRGKLKLKLGKKVVGSRAYSLAAGAAGTIKVKLAKAARKRIAKRGKVKLSLSLTAKGATGKTFKTAAKLTVKKPPKKAKKKRKAKKKQGGGGSALDGKYGKDSGGPDLRFTVTGGGRKIVNLTGSIGGYCSVYVPFGGGIRSEFRTLFPGIESMNVAADGSFSGSQKLSDTTTEITNGKLAGGIATGNVKVTSPGCISGTQKFKSRRTGP